MQKHFGQKLLGLATLAICGLTAGSAGAVSTSINYVNLGTGTDLQACLSEGEAALTSVGLALLPRTSSAAWASSNQRDRLYSVYCIMDHQIAIFSGSDAEENQSVDLGHELDRIMNNFINPPASGGK